MTAALSIAATGMLVALALWLFGGFMVRVAGAVLGFGGLPSSASTGSPTMAVATLFGAFAWLFGHWLYAVRHHDFRSPLARRVFMDGLPSRLDPTRRWGVPTIPSGGPRC